MKHNTRDPSRSTQKQMPEGCVLEMAQKRHALRGLLVLSLDSCAILSGKQGLLASAVEISVLWNLRPILTFYASVGSEAWATFQPWMCRLCLLWNPQPHPEVPEAGGKIMDEES